MVDARLRNIMSRASQGVSELAPCVWFHYGSKSPSLLYVRNARDGNDRGVFRGRLGGQCCWCFRRVGFLRQVSGLRVFWGDGDGEGVACAGAVTSGGPSIGGSPRL